MEISPNVEHYADASPNRVGGVIDNLKQRLAVGAAVIAASFAAAPGAENFDNEAQASQVPATEVNPISESGVSFSDCANAALAHTASFRTRVTTNRTNGRITNAVGRFTGQIEVPSIVECDGVRTVRVSGIANRHLVTPVLTLVGRNKDRESISGHFSATQQCKKVGRIFSSMLIRTTYSDDGRTVTSTDTVRADRPNKC